MAEEDEGRDKVYRRVSNSFRCYGQHIAGKYLQKGCKLAQKWFGNYQPVKAIKLPVIKPMPG